MSRIADVIIGLLGRETAQHLFDELGGSALHVPKVFEDCNQAQYLRQLLGETSAVLFMRYFGGELLYIPKGYYLLMNERNQQIQAEFDQALTQFKTRGEAVKAIALKFRITERRLYDVLHSKPSVIDDRQLEFNWN